MRKAVQVQVCGTTLVGTCHVSSDAVLTAPEGCPSEAPAGIVFFNPGYLPRAARGDLQVQLADYFSARGYPAFRFDLPGLGDSPGDLPEQATPLFHFIQGGGYTPWISALVSELKRRYALRGLILAGICGGAIVSVHAADSNEKDTLGLILLDLSFAWSQPGPNSVQKDPRLGETCRRGRAELRRIRQRARSLLLGCACGDKVRALYWRVKRAQRFLRGRRWPPEANLPLINAYRRLAGRGFPMLVLTATGVQQRQLSFDYIEHLNGSRNHRVTRVEVEGTNHSFVEGGGKLAATNHIEAWLRANFPCNSAQIEPDARSHTDPTTVSLAESG